MNMSGAYGRWLTACEVCYASQNQITARRPKDKDTRPIQVTTSTPTLKNTIHDETGYRTPAHRSISGTISIHIYASPCTDP